MKSSFVVLFTLVLIYTDSFAQVNLNAGLVGNFPFSGNANDVSGNNHHGTLQNNIQLTTDRFGNLNSAFLFDGVDDYIAVNDNMGDFSTPHFSLVLWFKTSSNNVQNLVGKRNFGPTNGQQYQFFINYPPFPGIGSNIISDQNVCGIGITSSTSYINSAKEICADRWYSAVIVFDGLFHKIYINGVLMRSAATSFNAMAPCNSELRFGNWWQDDLIPFKGVMDDIRWYNRPLTDDEIAVLSENTTVNTSADFIFQKEICSPQQVRFFNLSPLNTNIQWDFGDGNMSVSSSPVHYYPVNGVYPVTLVTGNTIGCRDTIRKNVDLGIAFGNSILTADTTICQGDSVAVRVEQSAGYCWNPTPTLFNYGTVFAKPTSRTTYIVKQDKSFQNLVVNGDFENGNTGFTSDYIFSNKQTADGQYGIVTGAKLWMPSVVCTNCSDLTAPGTGSMLISDGSSVSGKNVWCQQINVQPGKEYKIVFWTKLLTPNSRPIPELKINGNTLEGVSLLSPDDDWLSFTASWNSGTNSTLDLCLGNGNINAVGNVFALDGISVTESGFFYDSVTIDVSNAMIAVSNDTSICKNGTVQLNASGGTTYTWSPVTGLSDPTISNPIAHPAITTRYSVKSLVNGSCMAKDSILVTINPLPSVVTNNEASACPGFPAQLTASGGIKYQWSPSQTLSDATLPNPLASPSVNTIYTVVVTDNKGCSDDGEVKVSIAPTGKIYIPNAFTPNSDGVNDCFSIKGAQGSSIFELAIYNRFGEKVFYTNNPSNCWDGSFKGKPQASGAFAYTLRTSGPCGAFTEKGTVTVIR
jgi:gliding motility-associated-like protein